MPVLLGAGDRLFEGVRELGRLQFARTVAPANVTHLKFVRRLTPSQEHQQDVPRSSARPALSR